MIRTQRWDTLYGFLQSIYHYNEEGYYLLHAETEILRKHVKEIMQLVSPDELVELGSGSSTKMRILIEAMHSTGCHRYSPLDISETALQEAVDALTADYDWLEVNGQLGDFDTDLPRLQRKGKRLAFLSSNISNHNLVSNTDRAEFLANLESVMEKGDALLLGVGLKTSHLFSVPVMIQQGVIER